MTMDHERMDGGIAEIKANSEPKSPPSPVAD
jgi:hypothetical protein